MSRFRTTAFVIATLLASLNAIELVGQLPDRTETPNAAEAGIGLSLVNQVGAGRGDLGPNFHERNYDGTMQREFLTTALWGVGSTPPYGHDGRSMTLHGVIRRHGVTHRTSASVMYRCPSRGRSGSSRSSSRSSCSRRTTPHPTWTRGIPRHPAIPSSATAASTRACSSTTPVESSRCHRL